MQSSPGENLTFSRKLKRPLFVFFRAVTVSLFTTLAILAVMRNETCLMLVALFGGSLWFVLAFILICNWQIVTLFQDHLVVNSFGKKHHALYKDIREVKAVAGEKGIDGPIAVPTLHFHCAQNAKPLKVNLANIAVKDRVLLLTVVQKLSPQARLNHHAREIQRGERTE